MNTQPKYYSAFGGMWIDREDAPELLAQKVRDGEVSEADAEDIRFFMENGYLIIRNAITDEMIEALNADFEQCFTEENEDVWVDWADEEGRKIELVRPKHLGGKIKVLDLYSHFESARRIVLSNRIVSFLEKVFEEPVLAFQSLSFLWGTQQRMHQDTAYVILNDPMKLCASWVALEDVQIGSGELEYYVKSHRLPEFLFAGNSRRMLDEPDRLNDFLDYLQSESQRRGLELQQLVINKGDALIWHADLAHGGSRIVNPEATRKSIVTHYCPLSVDPEYMSRPFHSDKMQFNASAFYAHQLRGRQRSLWRGD